MFGLSRNEVSNIAAITLGTAYVLAMREAGKGEDFSPSTMLSLFGVACVSTGVLMYNLGRGLLEIHGLFAEERRLAERNDNQNLQQPTRRSGFSNSNAENV